MNKVFKTKIWLKLRLTSFGATGRCVLLSSSLSTSMYLLGSYSRMHQKHTKSAARYFLLISKRIWLTSPVCFPSAFGLPVRKCSSLGSPLQKGHDNVRQKKKEDISWHERRCGWCVAEPHIERRWAELDVALDDEAHRFLHVPLGDGQGAASLWQATLRKHLQQVLLLGLPPACWWLHRHSKVKSIWIWERQEIEIALIFASKKNVNLGSGALCLCV